MATSQPPLGRRSSTSAPTGRAVGGLAVGDPEGGLVRGLVVPGDGHGGGEEGTRGEGEEGLSNLAQEKRNPKMYGQMQERKGNLHAASQAPQLGQEINTQAFVARSPHFGPYQNTPMGSLVFLDAVQVPPYRHWFPATRSSGAAEQTSTGRRGGRWHRR